MNKLACLVIKNTYVQKTQRRNPSPQHLHSELQPTSSANAGGLGHLRSVPVRVRRDLHLLAQRPNGHGLPAADLLHLGKELCGGPGRVHVGGNVCVVHGALLEDSDAVVIRANGVMGVFERCGNVAVGVDLDARLSDSVSDGALVWR